MYFGKPRVQAVARLARFAVADAVGQDDEVARRIEHLARAEQLAAEGTRQEARAGSAGAVQDQDRIAHDARGVAPRRAERSVVQFQRGQRFAASESKSRAMKSLSTGVGPCARAGLASANRLVTTMTRRIRMKAPLIARPDPVDQSPRFALRQSAETLAKRQVERAGRDKQYHGGALERDYR